MADPQTYATHRRYIPPFHFFVLPILGLNVLLQLYIAIRHYAVWSVWWNVLVAVAFVLLALSTRAMATTAQDRIIRLEETLRLQRVLPEELRGRIGELTVGQMIAMRFCADQEVPDLCRAVLSGEVKGRDEIKKRIKSWRPDTLRV